MENNKITNCNQCPNQCPADALKCGRGRHYFEQLENPEGFKMDEKGEHGHGEGHGENHGHRESHGHGENHGHGHKEGHGRSDDLYGLMRGCGHYLHHNSGGHQEAGGENGLFAALDEGEQECLKGLLKKLLNSWEQ